MPSCSIVCVYEAWIGAVNMKFWFERLSGKRTTIERTQHHSFIHAHRHKHTRIFKRINIKHIVCLKGWEMANRSSLSLWFEFACKKSHHERATALDNHRPSSLKYTLKQNREKGRERERDRERPSVDLISDAVFDDVSKHLSDSQHSFLAVDN